MKALLTESIQSRPTPKLHSVCTLRLCVSVEELVQPHSLWCVNIPTAIDCMKSSDPT